MSLGLVMVGADVGLAVGLVEFAPQSIAAPGSSGGTQLLGLADAVGALDGMADGSKLGRSDAEGAADFVGAAEMDGRMDGAWERVGFALCDGVPVGLCEAVGCDGFEEGEREEDGDLDAVGEDGEAEREGEREGDREGEREGWSELDGDLDGEPEGFPEGGNDPEGAPEGFPEGFPEGEFDPEGEREGEREGLPEGEFDSEGAPEGFEEGEPVGLREGEAETVVAVCWSRLTSPSSTSRNNARSLGGGQGYLKTSSIW